MNQELTSPLAKHLLNLSKSLDDLLESEDIKTDPHFASLGQQIQELRNSFQGFYHPYAMEFVREKTFKAMEDPKFVHNKVHLTQQDSDKYAFDSLVTTLGFNFPHYFDVRSWSLAAINEYKEKHP